MKPFFIKPAMVAAFALFVPSLLFAQNEEAVKDRTEKEARVEKRERDEKKEVQQIIITRKGDKDEKTVIEIKGDKVTVNGKDVSKLDNVTVNLNNLSDLRALQFNGMNGTHDFNFDFNDDVNNRISLFSEDANRAMLGVVTDEDEGGAKITAVTKESAAEKAGLKVGDVITKIGNEEVDDADDVSKAVRNHKPGDKVTVSFLRGGKGQKLTAELSKWKGVRINSLNTTIAPVAPVAPRTFGTFNYSTGSSPKLGLSVQDTDDGNGVKVLQVAEESSAAKAGVKKDDVITHINDEDVTSTDEVKQAMREARNNAAVKLQVLRNGKPQTIEVRIPRKLKTTDL